MTEERGFGSDSSGRLHVVLVPGFADFDALGQLEYYAGVTEVFDTWARGGTPGRPVVLHYFDNLPTAGVTTRAERLQAYLAKRIARHEIAPQDRIALVGHSTGGLDIRRLLFSGAEGEEQRVIPVDGAGGEAKDETAAKTSTAVEVAQQQILDAVDCLVFLSVPQCGTNIADWTRAHRLLRRTAVENLHLAVEGTRLPLVDDALTGVLGGLGQLAHRPDLVLAAADSVRETTAPEDDPFARAAAQEAASQLRLWLQHAVDDFAAIDDLAAAAPPGSTSPAHYDEKQRRDERAVWQAHEIRTMSVATISRRAFRLPPGEPAAPLSLTDPRTWPNHDLSPSAEGTTDASYLIAYRACAGGPFDRTPAAGDDIADLDLSLFDRRHLDPDGPRPGDRLELWDNDGIVNTASMLWPDGPRTHLVAGDHGDVIGHYRLRRVPPSAHPSGRRYAAYDLLRSGTRFDDAMFRRVWEHVFDFCASR